MSNMLLGNWDNRFHIGAESDHMYWHINFDKYNQELFHLVNNCSGDFFITTGPGGFIGTRSIAAFLLGFTLYSNQRIYGFNLLLDILPYLQESNNKASVYIYQDLDRFFYKVDLTDIAHRKFTLLSRESAEALLKTHYVIGNWSQAHCFIELNFHNIFNAISALYKKNKTEYLFNKIDYSNW